VALVAVDKNAVDDKAMVVPAFAEAAMVVEALTAPLVAAVSALMLCVDARGEAGAAVVSACGAAASAVVVVLVGPAFLLLPIDSFR